MLRLRAFDNVDPFGVEIDMLPFELGNLARNSDSSQAGKYQQGLPSSVWGLFKDLGKGIQVNVMLALFVASDRR